MVYVCACVCAGCKCVHVFVFEQVCTCASAYIYSYFDHTWERMVHGDHCVTGKFQGLGVTGVLCK